MKKVAVLLLVLGVFFVFILLMLQAIFKMSPSAPPTLVPPLDHTVERLNGLKIKWQLPNTFIDYLQNGPYMRISNGKIFYLGLSREEASYHIIGINAADGSLFVKTDALGGGTEFTADDSALYIAKNISEIYKYDLNSQQRVWSQELGNSHAPCCMNVINNELQVFWYPNRVYSLSAQDGKVLREISDAQNYVYRIEDGIRYRRGGSSFLMAVKEDGMTLWETELKSYLMAPVFTKDTIYLRAGDRMGPLYALDRASGKIRWQTEPVVISNLAVSDDRVYYLTSDGQLLGVNGDTGEVETSASILPADLYTVSPKPSGYEVAYDASAHLVVLILGNSAQMIALEE